MSKNKIFKKHVCSSGTWACSLQRFQHPLPLLERESPQKWEGETSVQEAVLWGRLVGNRQWQRSCRRHFYFQPLQEGPEHPSENQLQFEGPQQWGKQNVCYTLKTMIAIFFFFFFKKYFCLKFDRVVWRRLKTNPYVIWVNWSFSGKFKHIRLMVGTSLEMCLVLVWPTFSFIPQHLPVSRHMQ